jgi:FtsP/CotA-like multicopper oxidase with cupredoxin domain
VAFEVSNKLRETTTLHWHGMLLPAEMDGGPHQMIEAGATWNSSWTIEQPAATTWYHPHLHGETALHVYRGLAGLFLIDDEESARLPSRYGVDDIPIIIQDKMFKANGELHERMNLTPFGMLGNRILVNGTYDPYLRITASRVRFENG